MNKNNFLLILALATAFILSNSASAQDCAITATEQSKLLSLPYKEFDQDLSGGGWRAYGDRKCYALAAAILDSYKALHQDNLLNWQIRIVTWHAGQTHAHSARAADDCSLVFLDKDLSSAIDVLDLEEAANPHGFDVSQIEQHKKIIKDISITPLSDREAEIMALAGQTQSLLNNLLFQKIVTQKLRDLGGMSSSKMRGMFEQISHRILPKNQIIQLVNDIIATLRASVPMPGKVSMIEIDRFIRVQRMTIEEFKQLSSYFSDFTPQREMQLQYGVYGLLMNFNFQQKVIKSQAAWRRWLSLGRGAKPAPQKNNASVITLPASTEKTALQHIVGIKEKNQVSRWLDEVIGFLKQDPLPNITDLEISAILGMTESATAAGDPILLRGDVFEVTTLAFKKLHEIKDVKRFLRVRENALGLVLGGFNSSELTAQERALKDESWHAVRNIADERLRELRPDLKNALDVSTLGGRPAERLQWIKKNAKGDKRNELIALYLNEDPAPQLSESDFLALAKMLDYSKVRTSLSPFPAEPNIPDLKFLMTIFESAKNDLRIINDPHEFLQLINFLENIFRYGTQLDRVDSSFEGKYFVERLKNKFRELLPAEAEAFL